MTEGSPMKHILLFTLPVFLGNLLQQLYNTVDTIIVGNYAGEDALAGVGTTSTITFLFVAIAMGFANGNAVLVAQYFGAGDEEDLRKAASTGIILLNGLGIAGVVCGIIFAEPIFRYLVKVPESIIGYTIEYFKIYSLGLIFQFGYNIFSALLRAVGDSSATLIFLFISSVINVVLDLLFVAVFKQGVAGAAIATVISQAASCAAALIYMLKKYPIFRFALPELKWNGRLAGRTFVVGMPMTLQLIVVSLGLTFIMRAVNGFGETMAASFTVGNRIEMYLNLPCNALQTTMATYTGQNIGAGRTDRVKKGAWESVALSFAVSVVIALVIWLNAESIISLFAISDAAMVYCIQHVRAIALINLILSAYIPLFGVFQGAGHSGLPMFVALCALSVRVAVTYMFRYSDFLGYRIIWINGVFGFAIGFTIAWSFFLSGRWKPRAIGEGE